MVAVGGRVPEVHVDIIPDPLLAYGLTVSHADWSFNVRPSNTEPLLRLNVEGRDEETMARLRDAVLGRIRSAQ